MVRRAALAGRAMMTFFTFAPGSEVPIHEHPHDQLSVVIRGKAAFTVEGEVRILGPGEGVRLPGGVRHGARIMDEATEIWDVWAPPREEYL
ncbi:MAG: cupin domain-containing protein [Bacteroidota bacterium]